MSWRRAVGLALSAAALIAFGAATPAPAASRPLSIVQLGDSIASGEGTLYGYRYDAKVQTWTGGHLSVTWPGHHDETTPSCTKELLFHKILEIQPPLNRGAVPRH